MKKVVGILLVLGGLLLASVGVAGVVLIGSDDTVDSPATTVRLGGARAVVSTPGVLAFTETTLRLTAESSGGAVFIGQAHPVDTRSFLDGAPTYAVTKVDTSGMKGAAVAGDAAATVMDPAKQSFWTAKAVGPGTQSLELALDGTPTSYVVMPVGTHGDLTMTSGVRVVNGFAASIGAVVLGLVVAVSGVLLWRRRRTPAPRAGDGSAADDLTAGPGADVAADVVGSAPRTTTSHRTTRIVGVAVIGALVPALAGCGMLPTRVEAWQSDAVTKPALANEAEAAAAMKDYDRRRNAVDATVSKSFDPRVWEGVDSGVALAGDRLDTRYAALTRRWKAQARTTTVKGVYASAWDQYPMYALVSTAQQARGEKPENVLVVMRRASSTSPWLKDSVTWHDAPLPTAAPTALPLTAPDRQAAMKAANAAMTSLNGGRGGPALPASVTTFLAEERTRESSMATATAKATYYNVSREDQLLPDGSVQAVRVRDGLLVQASYVVHSERTTKPGYTMSLTDEKYAAVSYQQGQRTSVRTKTAVTLTMTVDPRGEVKVIGHGFQFII